MKAKKIIITLAFALLMLGLRAQDKYEYATVIYKLLGKDKAVIETSIGDKYTETQVTYNSSRPFEDLTPFIPFLNKMGNEGWERYTTNTTTSIQNCVFYYLKRKKS
jgi:hypothetical protein